MRVTGDAAGESARGPVDVLHASGVAFPVQEHAPVIGPASAQQSALRQSRQGSRRTEGRAEPGRTGRSGAHRHDAWRGKPVCGADG